MRPQSIAQCTQLNGEELALNWRDGTRCFHGLDDSDPRPALPVTHR